MGLDTGYAIDHINSVTKYILEKARARILKKRYWLNDIYEAGTADGKIIYCDSHLAVKWSASGAVKREIYDYFPNYNNTRHNPWDRKHLFIYKIAEEYLEDQIPTKHKLHHYNAGKYTTHKNILKIFKKAIKELDRQKRSTTYRNSY